MMLFVSAAIAGQVLSQYASPWALTPVIAAYVLPVVGLTVTMMRYHHIDSTKTRDLIERTAKETAEQFKRSDRETAEQFERTAKETAEQFKRSDRETAEQFKRSSKETAEQFERSDRETAEQFKRSSKEFDLLRADVGEIGRSLNDARERLARIEGRLDALRPLHDGDDGETSRDAA